MAKEYGSRGHAELVYVLALPWTPRPSRTGVIVTDVISTPTTVRVDVRWLDTIVDKLNALLLSQLTFRPFLFQVSYLYSALANSDRHLTG